METEIDPIEKVLILTPIAGMFVSSKMLGTLNPFRETAFYQACYRTAKEPFFNTACVSVWWVGTAEDRRSASLVAAEAFTEGAERVKIVEGNRIRIRDLAKTYAAVWSSGARVVNIIFYSAAFYTPGMDEQRARAAESSPEMRREMLRQYLVKFPSSE